MSAYAGTAFVEVRGDFTMLNRQLAREMGALSSKSSRIGRTIASGLRVGLAGAGVAAFEATKQFTEFNQQMTYVATQAGAGGKEVDKLKQKVIDLSKHSRYNATQLAESLFFIESHAYRGAKAFDILTQAQRFAAVGGADLRNATRALTAAMKSGIKGTETAAETVKTLHAAIGQGSLEMNDLIAALGTGVVPAARTFGLSLRDVTGALDVLTRTGATAQLSATRLRYAFALLAAPTDKAIAQFSLIGLGADDLAKDMRKPNGLLIAIRDLHDHLQKLPGGAGGVKAGQVLARAFGGARSFATIAALVQHVGDLRDVYIKTQKQAENFDKSVRLQEATPSQKFTEAWNAVKAEFIQLGEKIAPALSGELLKLSKIITDPNLTNSEKWGKITGELNRLLDAAGHKMINVVKDNAPKVAEAFVKGFINAGPMTRLLVGGWLINRLVGWGNIFSFGASKIGSRSGTAMGTSMGASLTNVLKVQLAQLEVLIEGFTVMASRQIALATNGAPMLGRNVASGRFTGYTVPAGAVKGAATHTALPGTGTAIGAGPAVAATQGIGQSLAKNKTSLLRRMAGGLKSFGAGMGVTLGVAAALTFGPELGKSIAHGLKGTTSFSLSGIQFKDVPKQKTLFGKPISGGATIPGGRGVGASSFNASRVTSGTGVKTNFNADERAQIDRLKTFGQKAQDTIKGMLKLPHNTAARQLQDYARTIRDTIGKSSTDVKKKYGPAFDELADKVEQLAIKTAGPFQDVSKMATTNFHRIIQAMRNVEFKIENLGPTTKAGAKALALNFEGAKNRIMKVVDEKYHGSIPAKVQEAIDKINKDLSKALIKMGIDPSVAKAYAGLPGSNANLGGSGFGGGGKKARGGFVGMPGEAGQDQVPMRVPPGTPVLNRHQLAALGFARGGRVPVVVGRGEYVGSPDEVPMLDSLARARGFNGLDGLFSRVRQPHYLAKGGTAGGHSLAGLRAGMASFARMFTKRFGLGISATTEGQHASDSFHYKGEAVDFTAAGDVMNKAAAWIKSSGAYKQLAEGIHNPNLSVKFGKAVPSSFWGSDTWANHRNHIHVAIAGALSGKFGGAAQKIARRAIKGANGMFGALGQGASDTVHTVAQGILNKAAASGGGDTMDIGPVSGSGASLMRQISRSKGWNFADWWALDDSETSHGANLSNPTSSARLRGQFIDINWGKYGVGSDPRKHPSMSEQIQAMARYIAARYGNPTKAWAYHKLHNSYAKGGFAGGQRQRPAVIAKYPKTSRKAPKGKKPHTKTVKPTKPSGPVAYAPELPPSDVAIRRVNSLIGDNGNIPKLAERYSVRGSTFDLQDFTFVVTSDPNTGADLRGPVGSDTGPHIDMAAVNARVGQLRELLGYQTSILAAYNQANDILKRLIPSLVRAVRSKKKQLDNVRKEVRKNLERIKKLTEDLKKVGKGGSDHKRLTDLRTQLRHEQAKKKPNKTLVQNLQDQISTEQERGRNSSDSAASTKRGINEQIDKLKARNKHLSGSATSLGSGGVRGTLLKQYGNLTTSLSTAKDDKTTIVGVSGIGGGLGDTNQTISELTKQIGELVDPVTGQPSKALQIQLGQSGGGPEDNSAVLADLYKSQRDEANLRYSVLSQQFNVLRYPFGGVFHEGGVVPGPLGQERMILAQGGERVTPLGGDGPTVRVVVEDHRMRVFVDDIEQKVEQVTRKQARKAGRNLPGSGGLV